MRSWLFTVARRLVIDEWRSSRSRRESLTDIIPEQARGDDTDQILQTFVVTEALRQLTPEHREVLVQCFYRGSSIAEAARLLGIPEGTVKSRTHYALLRLRLALDEMGAGS